MFVLIRAKSNRITVIFNIFRFLKCNSKTPVGISPICHYITPMNVIFHKLKKYELVSKDWDDRFELKDEKTLNDFIKRSTINEDISKEPIADIELIIIMPKVVNSFSGRIAMVLLYLNCLIKENLAIKIAPQGGRRGYLVLIVPDYFF